MPHPFEGGGGESVLGISREESHPKGSEKRMEEKGRKEWKKKGEKKRKGGGRKEGKGEGGGKMGGEDKCTSCSCMYINLNSIWHRQVIKMFDLYTVIVIYRVRGTNVS